MELVVVGAEGASVVESIDALPDVGFVWCDCVYSDGPVWTAPVQRLIGIHVLDEHLRDAENVAHPSSFDSTNDYEIIVFRGLALRVEALDASDVIHVKTRPVVFFLFPRVLVTVRAPDSRLMASTRTRLMSAAGRARLPTQPEELMLRILNAMVDRYLELRQPLSAQLDRWQRQLLDTRRPFNDWYSLLDARRDEAYFQLFSGPAIPVGEPQVLPMDEARRRVPPGAEVVTSPLVDIAALARFAATADPAQYPPEAAYIRDADAKPQEKFRVARLGPGVGK